VGGNTIHSFAGCGVPGHMGDFSRMSHRSKRETWEDLEVVLFFFALLKTKKKKHANKKTGVDNR